MKIPLPCKFGELSDCDGKLLPLCGVHWFDWCPEDNIHIFLKQGINGIPTLFMKPVRNSSLFLWKYQMIFFLTILTCIQIRGLIWSLILFGGIFSYTNNIRSNNQEGRSKKGSEIHFVFQKNYKRSQNIWKRPIIQLMTNPILQSET